MNRTIYTKLARDNILKNKNTYFPFILSTTIIVTLFYILYAISSEVGQTDFYGSGSMGRVLNLGVFVIVFFAVVFIFYTNSFLIKRRKNELGLYSVLGMEKKHISRVLSLESIYSGVTALGMGLLFGLLFSKLMFALLLNIIGLDTTLSLKFSFQPVLITLILFGFIFALIIFYNQIKIRRTSPIELIQGGQKGEREPKGNWVLGLIGGISLGVGYYRALSIISPLDELIRSFSAILLVIIGTYLLFTAGSILLIKALRKNKAFYYQKNNFVSVSNMLYRMKQNAVGLANIAILSTAVILILSTTLSLYRGLEDILDKGFPEDVVTSYIFENQDVEQIEGVVQDHAKANQVEIKNPASFFNLSFSAYLEENTIQVLTMENMNILEKNYELNIFTLEDYNQIYEENLELNKNEVFLESETIDWGDKELVLLGKEYKIKDQITLQKLNRLTSMRILQVVVADRIELETLVSILNDTQGEKESTNVQNIDYNYQFDLEGTPEDKMNFSLTLRDALNESIERVAVVRDKYTTRQDTLSIYGSLFFIGIFLGTIFMIATVLIIYYKQITEGYEDNDRFKILQEVGMSKSEVKKTIKSQILLVFFLPLIAAIIHSMVAFPLMNKLLIGLDLDNTKLFLSLTGIVILIFALSYGLVYRWTANVYYKIVK